MPKPRLDLAAIETSLRALRSDFNAINDRLESQRDPFGEPILSNLLAGYRFLDRLQEQDVDLFARGNSALLLQLNCLVTCGTPELTFGQCAPHFRETERRFYDDSNLGGIRSLMNYLADHRHPTVWRRAAGVYAHVLSEPQLFFEGNHRTGALLMSHILLRADKPPFVLSSRHAKAYFDPSAQIKGYRKRSLQALLGLPRLERRLAALLEETADPAYLLEAKGPDMP